MPKFKILNLFFWEKKKIARHYTSAPAKIDFRLAKNLSKEHSSFSISGFCSNITTPKAVFETHKKLETVVHIFLGNNFVK